MDGPRGFHVTIAASREGKIRRQGRRGTRRRADATTSSRCRERDAEPRDDGSMRRHARAHGGFARRAPRGGASPGRTLVPAERVTRVLPTCFTENMEGALMSYHSFLRKTSWAFFLPPFLPLDMRLFLPTAILLGWGGRAAVKGLAGRPDAREIIRVFEPRRAGGNESLKHSDTQATSRKKTIQHVLKTLNTLAICFAGACLPSTASRNADAASQVAASQRFKTQLWRFFARPGLRRAPLPPSRGPLSRASLFMTNKRAKPDSGITMDDVDGFSAAELFGQGAS